MKTAGEFDPAVWLEYILLPKITLGSKLAWLKEFGSPGAVLNQNKSKLREISGEMPKAQADQRAVASALAWIKTSGGNCFFIGEEDYPQQVCEKLAEPPLAIFSRGNIELLEQRCVSLVGGPKPTEIAVKRASTFAYELAQENITVTAGVSAGIGSMALSGALIYGSVIGVIGSPSVWSGLQLAEEIATGGLLISEYPPSTPAPPISYAARHRLLVCLAPVCVFVEASGGCESMVLAALAGDCGAEVLAVPTDPSNKSGQGCNRLIAEGARLIVNSADILAALDS